MSKVVLLDAGPLGRLARPGESPRNGSCCAWALDLQRKGAIVRVTAIADYEVRRENVRLNRADALAELDSLKARYAYLPLCEEALRWAADYWAQARTIHGRAAGGDKLDADMNAIRLSRMFLGRRGLVQQLFA